MYYTISKLIDELRKEGYKISRTTFYRYKRMGLISEAPTASELKAVLSKIEKERQKRSYVKQLLHKKQSSVRRAKQGNSKSDAAG